MKPGGEVFSHRMIIILTQTTRSMKHSTLFVLSLCLVFLVGCSSKVKVSGKVTFQDGEPVPVGKVVFEDDQHTYFGIIQPDGKYSAGVRRDGDGIPPGKYRVAVAGAWAENVYDGETLVSEARPLIAEKWTDSKTSGLEYDIQKSMTINIEVGRR